MDIFLARQLNNMILIDWTSFHLGKYDNRLSHLWSSAYSFKITFCLYVTWIGWITYHHFPNCFSNSHQYFPHWDQNSFKWYVKGKCERKIEWRWKFSWILSQPHFILLLAYSILFVMTFVLDSSLAVFLQNKTYFDVYRLRE